VVAELSERGAAFVTGGVALDNGAARSFYESAGFRPVELRLVADVETLECRLAGLRGSSPGDESEEEAGEGSRAPNPTRSTD
jgi:hypothetical protein